MQDNMDPAKHSKYASARDKRNRRRNTKKYIAKQGVVFADPLENTQSVASAGVAGAVTGSNIKTGNPVVDIGIMAGGALYGGIKQAYNNKQNTIANQSLQGQKDAYEEHGNKAVDPNFQMQQAKNGMKRSLYAKDGLAVEMEKGEVHAQKDPKTGKYSLVEVGETKHSDGGDDIVLAEGGVVFPTQNPSDRQNIIHLIKKGDTEALDKISDSLPKADESGSSMAYKGLFNDPPNKNDKILKSLYGTTDPYGVNNTMDKNERVLNAVYGDGYLDNRNKATGGDEQLRRMSRKVDLSRNYTDEEAAQNQAEIDAINQANNPATNSPVNIKPSGMTEGSIQRVSPGNSTINMTGYKIDGNEYSANPNTYEADILKRDNTFFGDTKDEDSNEGEPVDGAFDGLETYGGRFSKVRKEKVDRDDLNVSGLIKGANSAYNFMRGMERPEVERGDFVKLKRHKYTDNTQAARSAALRAQKAGEKQINRSRTSRGQSNSYKTQNQARYLANQEKIDTQAVAQKMGIAAANVDLTNKETLLNQAEKRRVKEVNAQRRAAKRKYTGAAVKEASDLASVAEKTAYQKSRDAKLDERNDLLAKLVGTGQFKVDEKGNVVYTGQYKKK